MANQGEDVDVDPMAPDDMNVDPNPYVTFTLLRASGHVQEDGNWERLWQCETGVVYDQGTEPFCWALSTADVVAYRRAIILETPFICYSGQELMNSARPFAEETYTLRLERAFEFMIYNKISQSEDVPFLRRKDVCAPRTPDQSAQALGIVGYYYADKPSEDVLIAFLNRGPVVIGILASPEFGSLVEDKSNNIYQGAYNLKYFGGKSRMGYHAVVFGEGYDAERGQFYWRIKNSQGKDWGMRGFGKMVKDSSIPARYQGQTIISAFIPIFGHPSELCFIEGLRGVEGIKFAAA